LSTQHRFTNTTRCATTAITSLRRLSYIYNVANCLTKFILQCCKLASSHSVMFHFTYISRPKHSVSVSLSLLILNCNTEINAKINKKTCITDLAITQLYTITSVWHMYLNVTTSFSVPVRGFEMNDMTMTDCSLYLVHYTRL